MNTPLTQNASLTIDTGKNPDVKLGGELQQNTSLGNMLSNTNPTCTMYDPWQLPILLNTIITEEGVEQIFRQENTITTTSGIYPYFFPPPRIYKNVYRIVEGKLKLTETIEGKYIPQQEESYEF